MSDDHVTNRDLDRVVAAMEKSSDALAHMITENGKTQQELLVQQATMNTEMKEIRKDLQKVEELVNGNGRQGLKTKVELIEQELKTIKSTLAEGKLSTVEKTKGEQAIRAGIITGAATGLGAFVKMLIDVFLAQ